MTKKIFLFFLFLLKFFRKYIWVILFKDKKGRRITKAFQKALNLSGCKAKEQGFTRVANFTTDLLKQCQKVIILGFIQHIAKVKSVAVTN